MGLQLRCILLMILILCVFESTSDLNDFLVSLRTDFGGTVSNAWKGFVKAVKTPMKLRPRKKKKNKTRTTKMVGERETEFTETWTPITETNNVKPLIPVLKKPIWSSMLDWRNLHRSSLVEVVKDLLGIEREKYIKHGGTK